MSDMLLHEISRLLKYLIHLLLILELYIIPSSFLPAAVLELGVLNSTVTTSCGLFPSVSHNYEAMYWDEKFLAFGSEIDLKKTRMIESFALRSGIHRSCLLW